MNVLGYEVRREIINGQFAFTSKDLPELLVVSDDMDKAIADVEPSIRAILNLKKETR